MSDLRRRVRKLEDRGNGDGEHGWQGMDWSKWEPSDERTWQVCRLLYRHAHQQLVDRLHEELGPEEAGRVLDLLAEEEAAETLAEVEKELDDGLT